MNKSIKFTESQIKAFKNDATMFMFPIDENKMNFAMWERIKDDHYSHADELFLKAELGLQIGDKDVLVKEEFDFNNYYCETTTENFEALKNNGFIPLNSATEQYLNDNRYMFWTGKSSWDFDKGEITDEHDVIYARCKKELCNYTKHKMILKEGKFESEKQSRYTLKEILHEKIVRVQDIKIKEFANIINAKSPVIYSEFIIDAKHHYNQQLKENNINRTYEDNDHVILLEIKR